MGLIRGVRTLLKINQPGGVVAGLRMAGTDRERSHFEFCENGAKHVARRSDNQTRHTGILQAWSVADPPNNRINGSVRRDASLIPCCFIVARHTTRQ